MPLEILIKLSGGAKFFISFAQQSVLNKAIGTLDRIYYSNTRFISLSKDTSGKVLLHSEVLDVRAEWIKWDLYLI